MRSIFYNYFFIKTSLFLSLKIDREKMIFLLIYIKKNPLNLLSHFMNKLAM